MTAEFDIDLWNGDKDLDDFVEQIFEEWNYSEILDLLNKCEYLLDLNDSAIASLDEEGWKHFLNWLFGKDARNKKELRNNLQKLHRLSVNLHRAILKRMEKTDDVVRKLIKREDERDESLLDSIINLKDKVKETSRTAKESNWLVKIKQIRNADGKKYSELSIPMKAFRIVADYCKIYDPAVPEGEKQETIQTALDSLGIGDEAISVVDFYQAVLTAPEDILMFDYNDYKIDERVGNKLSFYGALLYDYPSYMKRVQAEGNLYEDFHFNKSYLTDAENRIIESNREKIFNAGCLCNMMIQDIAMVSSEIEVFRTELLEKAKKEEAQRKREEEERKAEEERIIQEKKNASILIITPESVQEIRGAEILASTKGDTERKHEMTPEFVKYLELNIPNWNPGVLVTGKGVRRNVRELNSLMKKGAAWLSLPDYYMYLWFCNTPESERLTAKVAFIEYYKNRMYVQGYSVSENGSTYKKEFEDSIHSNRTRNHLKDDICKRFNETWDKIHVFRTFHIGEGLAKRLNTIGVKKVYEQHWEDFLTVSLDDFCNTIHDLRELSRG